MTDLSARYGTTRRPRWFWPLVTVVGLVMGVALAAWVGFQDKPVTGRLYGYEVVDDNLVSVTLDVIRPEPIDVRCTVYAQAADHSVVGEKTVDVPADGADKTRVAIDIETERRAVNGVLRTCLPNE